MHDNSDASLDHLISPRLYLELQTQNSMTSNKRILSSVFQCKKECVLLHVLLATRFTFTGAPLLRSQLPAYWPEGKEGGQIELKREKEDSRDVVE